MTEKSPLIEQTILFENNQNLLDIENIYKLRLKVLSFFFQHYKFLMELTVMYTHNESHLTNTILFLARTFY